MSALSAAAGRLALVVPLIAICNSKEEPPQPPPERCQCRLSAMLHPVAPPLSSEVKEVRLRRPTSCKLPPPEPVITTAYVVLAASVVAAAAVKTTAPDDQEEGAVRYLDFGVRCTVAVCRMEPDVRIGARIVCGAGNYR